MNELLSKPPLIVYIVWHPDYTEGQDYANFLYSRLTRDVNQPVLRGLGIPVYFRNMVSRNTGKPLKIPLNQAKNSAVVVLMDDEMVASEGVWNNYLLDLCEQTKAPESLHRIYPVSISPHAFNMDKISEVNYIRLHDKEPERRLTFLSSSLFHELCRLMLNRTRVADSHIPSQSPSPVKLFISHAKQDGVNIAKSIHDYIVRELPLKTFFDAIDITVGYDFGNEIRANLKSAALLVIHTDAYASREWCRREVIMAKRFGCPMVVVNAISKGEERSFPYLGNVPTIRWDELPQNESDSLEANIQQTIDLMLYEVLRNIHSKQYLSYFKAISPIPDEVALISQPPELITLLNIQQTAESLQNQANLVLYPDPPLGDEELDLLSEFAPKLTFTTPIYIRR